MKQLINYINEALIKKDTKLKQYQEEYLIFIPWNYDYREFRMSDNVDDFDMIIIKTGSHYIWLISFTDIEKIKPYTKDSKTKIYYPPVKYSTKDQFIQACNDKKVNIEVIREYKEYQI